MENNSCSEIGADDNKTLEFTNSYGEAVEVRKFPDGYSGDPLLNELKAKIISAGVEP
jgi:hypothetical protein